MTGDWSTASSLKGRVAGSLAVQQSHCPPSSPLAVSSAASPSTSGVALKKDRSSDDAIIRQPSFAVIRRHPFWLHRQRSPFPASNGERCHNLLPPSLSLPPNRDHNQFVEFVGDKKLAVDRKIGIWEYGKWEILNKQGLGNRHCHSCKAIKSQEEKNTFWYSESSINFTYQGIHYEALDFLYISPSHFEESQNGNQSVIEHDEDSMPKAM
nr:DNA (cytosine-5)-methyltransferase 1B-like [Ipomoea batatas]